jgi:hypothetical protein
VPISKILLAEPVYTGLIAVASLLIFLFYLGLIVLSFLSRVQIDSTIRTRSLARTVFSLSLRCGIAVIILTVVVIMWRGYNQIQPMMEIAPTGMIFIPYGPPTCRLMGQVTDGTGMPTSKGWEVEVEALAGAAADGVVPSADETTGDP